MAVSRAMQRASSALLALSLLAACKTQTQPPGDTSATPKPGPEVAPEVASEVLSIMDAGTNPCDDFYRYACGGWIDATQLPADQPRYGRFQALAEGNQQALRGILESDEGRLGTFYGACMDAEGVEAAGLAALEPAMTAIAGMKKVSGLADVAGTLKAHDVPALFAFQVGPDHKDPTLNIAHLSQGGLGLPDRDFYLKEGPQADAVRAAYTAHVAEMLTAAGLSDKDAAGIVTFETALAAASIPRDQMRDPAKQYNRISRDELAALTPGFDWAKYFAAVGVPNVEALNVYPPDFFTALDAAVKKAGAKTLRAYLAWQVLHKGASQLPAKFVDSDFAFFRKTLVGQAEPEPRWKRCVRATDAMLRDELGQLYVAEHFSSDNRSVALEMITGIEAAFEAGLPGLSWMDDETRSRAVEKMKAIVNKIGYPENWRSYDDLDIGKDHLANVVAASKHEIARKLSHYGKPVDKQEWHMSPPTVNAYYNPPYNEMVFPAGILQPPFFSATYPMAMNFGGIGMVMGHELTHGFDDQGRKFDGEGQLTEWWNETAVTKFEERAQCVDDLYSSYEVLPGVKLNGKLTLGENIADLGGIKQAHQAYLAWAEANGEDPRAQAIEGLTAEQLMFVSFGQIWCSKSTPEVDKMRALTDPHSHPRYRINGPLSNLPGFWEAFSCEEGTAMHPPADAVCEVW